MATSTINQLTNNSDSNYCKMPDGTLIQWDTITNRSTGNNEANFPVSFSATPFVVASPRYASSGSTDVNYYVVPQVNNNSNVIIYFRKATDGGVHTSTNASATYIAVGRWK